MVPVWFCVNAHPNVHCLKLKLKLAPMDLIIEADSSPFWARNLRILVRMHIADL